MTIDTARQLAIYANYDDHFPVFSMVLDVLVLCDIVVLHICHCKTDFFDDHYHAYAVLLSQHKSFVRFNDVLDSTILHAHKRNDTLYIYLKRYFFHLKIAN